MAPLLSSVEQHDPTPNLSIWYKIFFLTNRKFEIQSFNSEKIKKKQHFDVVIYDFMVIL